MRVRFVPLFLGLSIGLLTGTTVAAPFETKYGAPKYYWQVQEGLTDVRKNIESVTCGGKKDEPLTGASWLPLVRGLPGRSVADPLGAKQTGLGVRGPFTFPKNGEVKDIDTISDNSGAWGFLSACDITKTTITVPTDGPTGNKITIPINPKNLCRKEYGTATPKLCRELYDHLRGLAKSTYYDNFKDSCGVPVQFCFKPKSAPTRECKGEECRKIGEPEFEYLPGLCVFVPGIGLVQVIKEQLRSFKEATFYRHYDTDVIGPDTNQWQLNGECYGYYREDDPKTTITYDPLQDIDLQQCEIAFKPSSSSSSAATTSSASSAAVTPEWKPPEQQKGEWKPDPSIVGTSDVRPPRSVDALWKADTQTNLTLPDMEKVRANWSPGFGDPYDISAIAGVVHPVRQQAGKAAQDSGTNAFDDTGTREVSTWWEDQQREFLVRLRQPTVRLIMPSRFVLGLKSDDPLFNLVKAEPSRSDGVTQLTVHGGPEMLGSVLESLRRSFSLSIREVRIPLVVPLVSESEANTVIAEWKLWKIGHANHPDVAKVDDIIAKIEEYRDAAKSVPLVRQSLPRHIMETIASQEKLRTFFASWYEQNAIRLKRWSTLAQERVALQGTWRQINEALHEVEQCQLLWCSNQRYSLPIYSLLDSWLDGRDARALPSLSSSPYAPASDINLDFSWVSFSSGSSVAIPVLWPISVRIALPLPPLNDSQPLPSAATFPSLAKLHAPYHQLFSSLTIPSVRFPPGVIELPDGKFQIPEKYLIPQLKDSLGNSQTIADTMLAFIAGPSGVSTDTAKTMKGAYCGFTQSILKKADPDTSSNERIVHVENDLQERVARLFSRYMPNTPEDYGGSTALIPIGTSAPLDEASFKWQWTVPTLRQSFRSTYDTIRAAMFPVPPAVTVPFVGVDRPLLERLFPDVNPDSPIDLIHSP